MEKRQAKLSEPKKAETQFAGQRGAMERQMARASRGSGQPAVLTAEASRTDLAPHGKFGPTRIGGPSA